MTTTPHPLYRLTTLALTILSVTFALQAADKPDPTGTWTWTFTPQNGEPRTSTLILKKDGDKLAGTVTGRGGNESQIQNAKLAGDVLTFEVSRERGDNRIITKYTGTIVGDTIKGKSEVEREGQTRSRDWEAKRKASPMANNLTGTWRYSFTADGGQTFEPTLRLKQEGEKVTGVIVFGENERPISEGKIQNGEVTFKLVRERDGETVTTQYTGKVDGDRLVGKINSNWGGTPRTYDLDARRVKE